MAGDFPIKMANRISIQFSSATTVTSKFYASKGLYLMSSSGASKKVGFGLGLGKMGLPAESKTSKQ